MHLYAISQQVNIKCELFLALVNSKNKYKILDNNYHSWEMQYKKRIERKGKSTCNLILRT